MHGEPKSNSYALMSCKLEIHRWNCTCSCYHTRAPRSCKNVSYVIGFESAISVLFWCIVSTLWVLIIVLLYEE
jgi:hypothetical protein